MARTQLVSHVPGLSCRAGSVCGLRTLSLAPVRLLKPLSRRRGTFRGQLGVELSTWEIARPWSSAGKSEVGGMVSSCVTRDFMGTDMT